MSAPAPLLPDLERTAAQARDFLEPPARRQLVRFILGHRTRDGGFRGRGPGSDLYYTLFAVAALNALGKSIPILAIRPYLRSRIDDRDLDPAHLACLIRLCALFPMRAQTRTNLQQRLDRISADSAYDAFLMQIAAESLGHTPSAPTPPPPRAEDPTPPLAAACILHNTPADEAARLLLERAAASSGGFRATESASEADLLSTATALFALYRCAADITSVQTPCLAFIESLWRDDGGFAGCGSDPFSDVEYTFYALLSIGSLTRHES